MIRSSILWLSFLLMSATLLLAQAPAAEPTLQPRPSLETPSLGSSSGTGSADSGLTDEQLAAARAIVTRIDEWSPKSNKPADASIELRELKRNDQGDKTVIVYALYGKNIPAGKSFVLGRWPLGEADKIALKGMTFDAQGRAICAGTVPGSCGDPRRPNQPIELPISAGRMEPVRFGIVSDDKTVQAYTTIVPFPNVAKDKQCKLEAVLGTPDRQLVMVEGSGFAPGETVKIHQSDPARDRELHVEADGTFVAALLHPVGDTTGNVNVKATAGGCAPEVTYDFGPNVYQRVKAGTK